MDTLTLARHRLTFDEMMMFSIVLRNNKLIQNDEKGYEIEVNNSEIDKLLAKLPYPLTGAQNRVLSEIIDDISCKDNNAPMNRLIQGDVGCGKTIVAIITAYITAKCGYQSAIMAPTEILANQHYEEFNGVLNDFGIHIALLTSSTNSAEKTEILERLADNDIDILIGTHAVLQESVVLII